ncbi:MAG TPA: bifunctional enoyl-CoA hydratase/phosphate acetyltransferase [Roseiarcus sp.]|nr:bifunctional enoyl-CoA hydratase/phosphate acetyltransferase [Roseiarcus sp.]
MNQVLPKNRTFDEIKVGETVSLTRLVSAEDAQLFSPGVNPAHLDPKYPATDAFGHIAIHGIWIGALISAVLGTRLPGPGTTYLGQELHFLKAAAPGDVVTATVIVREKRQEERIVILDTICKNQKGEQIVTGVATVIAPADKLVLPPVAPPEVALRRHDRYEPFIAKARALPPLLTAIVHPCSVEALQAAVEAHNEGLVTPVLVGPEAKIRTVADAARLSLRGLKIIATEHSHAAAEKAVFLAASGQVDALMKGSLHSNELLEAVVAPQSGLRTERRISHVYVMDAPAYPKPLIVTDAAINIAPTLAQKRDICQNAVDFLQRLGVAGPLVAVLAAVETIDPAMPATLDAACLAMMARRGQITGAQVDGPLAFDNAVSLDAARIKEIVSPVAGKADILVAPNLEAANMLAKQLIYLGGADAAGLVLGARAPIILTSRADSLRARLASVAFAKLIKDNNRLKEPL